MVSLLPFHVNNIEKTNRNLNRNSNGMAGKGKSLFKPCKLCKTRISKGRNALNNSDGYNLNCHFCFWQPIIDTMKCEVNIVILFIKKLLHYNKIIDSQRVYLTFDVLLLLL